MKGRSKFGGGGGGGHISKNQNNMFMSAIKTPLLCHIAFTFACPCTCM